MGFRLVRIECECGSTDGWDLDQENAECWDCGTHNKILFSPGNMMGKMFDTGADGLQVLGVDRPFTSHKEFDAYLDAKGESVMTKQEKQAVKWENKNENDKDAQKAGFKDGEDRSNFIKNKREQSLERAREHRSKQATKTDGNLTVVHDEG